MVVQEYAPPKTIDAQKARQRMLDVIAATIAVLGISPNKVVLKTRERKGKNQYQGWARRVTSSKRANITRACGLT
ncbi:hypothetical protein ACNKHS_05670 [Shigella flexneri]